MPIDLELSPKQKRPAGEPCCEPVVYPDVSHHLKRLRDAGIVDSERQGLWAYYYVLPDALEELSAWLS